MTSTVLLEARPYKPFMSSEEYLYAMREDLAEWFNTMYPELNINVDNFMDRLDTGVALCKHANNVRAAAEEYLVRRMARNKSMTKSMTSGAAGPILSIGNVHYLPAAKSGTFFSRDNVSNFITWCRKGLHIFECLLFETDDLIMRKNEKHVILCLLEVARRGARFGMLAPMLVQMERQIDREIAADNKAAGVGFGTQTDDGTNTISTGTENDEMFDSDSEDEEETSGPLLMYGPQPQIVTNDLKSLDEMVRDLVEKCTCQSQFPMIRVSEGKYRIGDTKILIFVRILRSHVMVRVGGGWDTLSHYLDKHDPCRCKAQHRQLLGAKIKTRTNQATNGIELHRAQVYYERTPLSSLTSTPTPGSVSSNLSTPTDDRGRSRSPSAPRRTPNLVTMRQSPEKSMLASPNMARRSISPSPRRFNDIRKKQHSLDSNNPCAIAEATASTVTSPNGYLSPAVETAFAVQTDSKVVEAVNGVATVGETVVPGSNKYENISDNGSEISDEGYRSLGLIQSNAQKRISLHSQASNEDAEISGRLEQTSNESQNSTSDENVNSPKYGNADLSKITRLPATPSPPPVTTSPVIDEPAVEKPQTDFNKSGIFITDDEISIDISDTTGLRKTGFSEDLYTDDKLTPKKPVSKLPQSPRMTRRRSVETLENNSGLPLSRKIPIYRSVRKPAVTPTPAAVKEGSPKESLNCTWSGRTAKKRAPLSAETFQSPPSKPGSPSPLRRNTPVRGSQYDKNGRRIKPIAASVNTSPNKTSASTSELAQQLLEAAENAQNDKQILARMKELLSKYASDDFTTAWVNSNGTLDRTSMTPSPKSHKTKQGSVISSAGSTHSKDEALNGGRMANKLSRIPAPVRANTGLY